MAKIGRNDPCPCGSGKKYKQCCLAKDEAAALAASPPAETKQSRRHARAEALAEMAAEYAAAEELAEASNAVVDMVHGGRLDEAERAAHELLERFPEVHDGYDPRAAIVRPLFRPFPPFVPRSISRQHDGVNIDERRAVLMRIDRQIASVFAPTVDPKPGAGDAADVETGSSCETAAWRHDSSAIRLGSLPSRVASRRHHEWSEAGARVSGQRYWRSSTARRP
jgi:SEC-C motif